MTIDENLLVCVGEECGEIQQEASKILRFGTNHKRPSKSNKKYDTNGDALMVEFYQLMAVIEMLQEQNVLPVFDIRDIKNIKRNKKNKIDYYIKKSKELGRIKED